MEILSDFNGWSWDKTFTKKFDYIDNLIYQNLLIILGEKFLTEWRSYSSTKRDFLEEARIFIKYFTGNDRYLKNIYKVLFLKSGNKKDIADTVRQNRKLLNKMEDKNKFIQDLKNYKLKITKRLQKIELILSDFKIMEKELIKINSKLDDTKKIKSVKKYKQILTKEKDTYIYKISEIDYMLNSKNFAKKKELLENSIELFECYDELDEVLLYSQKEFLVFLDKKVNKIKTRDEMVDLLYELRYYKNLKISKDVYIYEIKELNDYIDKIMKKAITMLCKIGAIKIISMDINLNFEIIKYAIDTKIIELEKIKLYFEKEDKENLIIKVYDKDVIEKQGRKKMKISEKTLDVKEKRKIKLFN